MSLNKKSKIQNIIKQALEEDIGSGDITTNLLVPKQLRIKAIILAKEKGVVAGVDVARLVFKSLDRRIKFKPHVKDGESVKADEIIADLEGPARGILTAERTALNFLSRLSGIATKTNRFVRALKRWKVKIMDTRKTTPELRCLEKYAVRMGGGYNHRMGLFDMVLIKDNHLKIQKSSRHQRCRDKNQNLKNLIKNMRKKIPRNMKIETEVKNLNEFREALRAKPDIIMLDNMNLKQIQRAVQLRNNLNPKIPKLEVSGRVNLKNIQKIAKTGVEMVSIGLLTHSAESLDMSLEVIK